VGAETLWESLTSEQRDLVALFLYLEDATGTGTTAGALRQINAGWNADWIEAEKREEILDFLSRRGDGYRVTESERQSTEQRT